MMNAPTFRPASNIVAATILGASLIASALIVTQQPVGSTANNGAAATSAKPVAAPPIAQDSVKEQFQKQLLAAPTERSYWHKGKKYTMTDVNIEQVTYSAKDDQFSISYQLIWEPTKSAPRAYHRFMPLYNDGYGHYYGSAPIDNGQRANVTIR